MDNDIVLKCTISLRVCFIPQEHPHSTTLTIGRSAEVSVVNAIAILNRDGDAVVRLATLAKVVVLEVEGRLGEAVLVRDVVNCVDKIERIGAGGVQVSLTRRRSVGALLEDKLKTGTRLRGSAGLAALERDGIVAAEGKKSELEVMQSYMNEHTR